jgi:predicted kinase
MTTLIITRGLPASGKTTWAQAWVNAVASGRVRVNRDDLRHMLYGRYSGLTYAEEETVTIAQHAAVRSALVAGRSVVVDDTNLRAKHARAFLDLAVSVGAGWEVRDFTHVTVDECIARDMARGASGSRSVGADVIRSMHDRYLGRPLPPVAPTEAESASARLYVPNESLPPAWIVDVDGTLAIMGDRSPFDWHRVREDEPNTPVVELVTHLSNNAAIVVMSGRDEVCRADTKAWLDQHVTYDVLHMRGEGDTRRDAVVKAELFWERVAQAWNVRGVVDDRDQVVAFWRSIGLMCAQVAPGSF